MTDVHGGVLLGVCERQRRLHSRMRGARAMCLERPLRSLERAERRVHFSPVPRRRRADVALEETREVALIRKSGTLRDHVERLFAPGDLWDRPRDPEPPAVLADRDAEVGAEDAREM